MRSLFGFLLLFVATGCPAPGVTQDTKQPASTTQSQTDGLSGQWRGSSSGLSVTINLQQAGDSVKGSGVFTLAKGTSVGCGGESLPASGGVTVAGALTGTEFQGRMTFADTWSPPYVGKLSLPDSLNGHFMSIDRGGCPLLLIRQR